ncbi:class E sortase [Actinoplanes sp. NPDC051851]|uniref:class E sortase n=1 Tax=Actinoplanes sp. NPDC051851 TaxID=3154753 RepID=UPI00341D46EF
MTTGRVAAVLGVLATVLLLPSPAAAAGPSVTVDRASAKLGDTVGVTLTGWPGGVVTAALCGNEGRQGSADCAVASASSVSVPATGSARLTLTLVAPPVGCPCVVRAATVTGDRIASVTIDVPDVPDNSVVSTAAAGGTGADARLTVSDVDVVDRWSLAALVGGPAVRTLRLTVHNAGTTAVTGAELSLDLGRAAGSSAPEALTIGAIAAGGERRVETTFTVAAPAIGRYPIAGRIDAGAGAGTTFTATTSSWPLLLPLLPFALVLLVIVVRRVRRSWRPTPLTAGAAGLIGAGAVCAAVLAVQTLLPGPETADAQRALDDQLSAEWAAAAVPSTAASGASGAAVTSLDALASVPAEGEPFAVIWVPRWDTKYTVVEGVTTADLRKGPGHYPGSALPGQVGNLAIAGHRGPAGLPFNDIDDLRAGDPIVIETQTAWYVYRVQRHVIVAPTRVDVIAPTPEKPGVEPTTATLTMTACHPRYSSKQRYVLFSALDQVLSKATGQRPSVLD